MSSKIHSSSAWLAVGVMLASGLALGSDCSPPPCVVGVSLLDGDRAASGATSAARRTESVTLLVRGMLKSRSGAT